MDAEKLTLMKNDTNVKLFNEFSANLGLNGVINYKINPISGKGLRTFYLTWHSLRLTIYYDFAFHFYEKSKFKTDPMMSTYWVNMYTLH